MTVETPDHILPQKHQMLREAGTESSTALSHHTPQQHLGKSDVLGPSSVQTHHNTGLFLNYLAMSVN